MDQRKIVSILKKHDVDQLFHADTVLTSLSFLQAKGICSRQYLDSLSLNKTDQYTDETDKSFDVYDDLFFDSVDIHKRTHNRNKYGPVTFVFDLKMLLNQELKNKIFITKSNAAYWKKGMRPEQRYFLTVEDLAQGFVKGNFGQNITFHHVPFQDFSALQYIILERLPAQHTNLFEDAYHEIRNKLRELGYSIPLVIRKCDDDCKCFNEYNKMSYDKLLKYFKTKGDQ